MLSDEIVVGSEQVFRLLHLLVHRTIRSHTNRMNRLNASCSLLVLATTVCSSAHAVGFSHLEPANETSVELGIWYPTEAPVPAEPNTPFGQALAIDAEPVGEDLPLIILSHGNGSRMERLSSTALALSEAGYVAVGITHSDDNFKNKDANPSEWIVSRPQEVVSSIDFMLKSWSGAEHISRERIGVFGFSAGGYTAVVAAGGEPNFDRAAKHCDMEPTEFLCKIGTVSKITNSSLSSIPPDFPSDSRIKAISVAAPGFGFAFDPKALDEISARVQIWSGSLDERVPHASNGMLLADSLGGEIDLEIVEGAGHFAFLPPCRPGLELANPRIWEMACIDAPGFDRVAFHSAFNARIVAFFDKVFFGY